MSRTHAPTTSAGEGGGELVGTPGTVQAPSNAEAIAARAGGKAGRLESIAERNRGELDRKPAKHPSPARPEGGEWGG